MIVTLRIISELFIDKGGRFERGEAISNLFKEKVDSIAADKCIEILDKLEQQMKYFQELKMIKIKELGEENTEMKGVFTVKEENLEEFYSEMNSVLDKEIEIEDRLIVTISELKHQPLLSIDDRKKLFWIKS